VFTSQKLGAPNEEKRARNRPFWTILCSTLSTLSNHIAILVAGTHIGIQSEDAIISATLKSGEEKSAKLITVSDFR
jgi:hypothetical protein